MHAQALHHGVTLIYMRVFVVHVFSDYSKSDFVVYKLKAMRKIDEKDITEICRQFSRLDPENSGKITLSCLINLHKASALKK